MAENCSNSMPRFCARKFEEISRAVGQIDGMAEDIRLLRRAVVGNGRVDGSLGFRVAMLEEAQSGNRSRHKRWGERIWKLVFGIALVLCGWWLKSD